MTHYRHMYPGDPFGGDPFGDKEKKQRDKFKKPIVKEMAEKNIVRVIPIENSKLTYKKVCVICRSEFTASRSHALCCSKPCQRKLRSMLNNFETPPFYKNPGQYATRHNNQNHNNNRPGNNGRNRRP